jgi:CHAT domain-containing protein/tetratricopeptide (TPR) repeat protein
MSYRQTSQHRITDVRRTVLALLLFAATQCTTPPPDAYVGAVPTGRGLDVGTTATDESCHQRTDRAGNADIYCADWEQPAGSVRRGNAAGSTGLDSLATSGAWRDGIDMHFACEPPASVVLANAQSALLLRCKRRNGGLPQVALVASVDGQIYFADGILPVLPVLERSIGVLSGHLAPAAALQAQPPPAMRQLIERLSARAFTVGDVAEFDRLMALGARANLSEDFASAATAYRAALKLQQKALGRDDPNTSVPLMSLALQLSDQGQFSQADSVFAQADRLAPNAVDQAAPARLLHYRALHQLNQDRIDDALTLLTAAERAYAALAPPEAVAAPGGGIPPGDIRRFPSQRVLVDPVAQSALKGLVEVRRYRSIALRKEGQIDTAQTAMRSAQHLAEANALVQPIIGARVARTAAQIDAEQHNDAASSASLDRAVTDFRLALPLTRPFAATELLRAATQMRDGDVRGAIERCRTAARVLRDLKLGIDGQLLEPCLSAFAARAGQSANERQALLAEMFEVAELGEGSLTSQLIAQASARLAQTARDPRVAQAIRRRQDAEAMLGTLYSTRDTLAESRRPGGRPYDGPPMDAVALDGRIAAALDELKDSDAAVQEVAPNYGQLLQQVVSPRDVFALLHPGEAFAQVTVAINETWTLLLRDGQISLGHSEIGLGPMTRLVVRLRATLARQNGAVPDFATGPAHGIYAATLGTVASPLADATALVVAPSGPLFSLPFALLLTEDFSGADLSEAPWLVRSVSIAHVPSAANFVGLRRAADVSQAIHPWFGFGDFRPVTRAVAARSFPEPACAEVAAEFAGLSPLPNSRVELEKARTIMGASAADVLLGPAFTADAVRRAQLKSYRIIHFSTHALLPSTLDCQPQQIIVTSAPRGAMTADGAMLLADDALALDLDADAVILSACNSLGRGGRLAGESLSALARAFFYAGSRSLLATHWSLNDAAAEQLVTTLLRNYTNKPGDGLAQSLRAAQLALIASAGRDGAPASLAHPFFWAPMALIGESGARQPSARTASNTP